MECRLTAQEDEGYVKKLWAYCFEKEDNPFFKWYFANIYKPENVLGVYDDNRLAGCLHLNPYTIYLRGTTWPVSYIVGVGTFPEKRCHGVAQSMLSAAFAEMRRRKHYISLLMPFAASFYYRYDFSLCYKYLSYEFPLHDLHDVKPVGDGRFREAGFEDAALFEKVYGLFMAERHGYPVRGSREWQQWLAAHNNDGGKAYIWEKDGEPFGYVVYYIEPGRLFVKEMAYLSFEARRAILSLLYSHYSQRETAVLQVPEDDRLLYMLPEPHKGISLVPNMMARIIDVEGVLSRVGFAYEEPFNLRIKIEDGYCVWNNRIFMLVSNGQRLTVFQGDGVDYEASCTIGAITQLIFGARSADELAFDGKLFGSRRAIQLLGRLWPKCTNFFNEEF